MSRISLATRRRSVPAIPASAWPGTVQTIRYVPGSIDREPDPLGLARPCAGIDVGQPFDLPVVEDRVVVAERQDDRPSPPRTRRSAGANAASRAVTARRRGAGVDPAVGGHDAAGQPERRERDRREEPGLAQAAERARAGGRDGGDSRSRVVRPRSRRELATTVTDESAIAPAASAGERAIPNAGIEDAHRDRDEHDVVGERPEQVLADRPSSSPGTGRWRPGRRADRRR